MQKQQQEIQESSTKKTRGRKFTADFETTQDRRDCRIWLWSMLEIDDFDNFMYGTTIEQFFDYLESLNYNPVIYMHNLKFDGEFIIYYLLTHDYKIIKDNKERKTKTFFCNISEDNLFYKIEVYIKVNGSKSKKVTFKDSLKIIPFSVSEIVETFKLPIQKLYMNYDKYRDVNYIPTSDEIDYIYNDCEIVARALKMMFDSSLTSGTLGADALNDYKKMNKGFRNMFPVLDLHKDNDIRMSYRGGFVYLNPAFQNKFVGKGIVLDCNSLYPSIMYNELLPYGEPIYYEGKYEFDPNYPLYIQSISVIFELKEGYVPTIQLKRSSSFLFEENEYLKSSNGEVVTLFLTSTDLRLFLLHYDIIYIKYEDGYKFKGAKGLFKNYIDKWMKIKNKAKKENNAGLYTIAKMMMNSLYGKFGTSPYIQPKYPTIDRRGVIDYKLYPKEVHDAVYLPVATFVTAYARFKTITTFQRLNSYTRDKYGYESAIYSDTDSIHTTFTNMDELKMIIDIDDYNLGYWKIEERFNEGKYIKCKCYVLLREDMTRKTTIAGLPKDMTSLVNFNNFNVGTKYKGKKKPIHVKGGIVLVDDDFTIHDK